MEFDIVPELLEKIMQDYENKVSVVKSDELFETLLKSNNLEDAYDYARQIGECLSESFAKYITADVLPNGRMYYNIANRIIPPSLKEAYKESEELTEIIMSNILSKSKIGLAVQKGTINADRITGIIDRLSEAENFNDVKFLTGKAVIQNVTQSAVDDTIEANAEFHYKSGIRARVERKLGGKCCKWCQSLVGTYTYPNVPSDVYRRHENCRCTVTYYPSKANKGQDVWTKQEISEEEQQNKNFYPDKRKMITDNIEDVTDKYSYNATPNVGKLVLEDGINDYDIEISKFLFEKYGGNITCLASTPTIGKNPDAIWNGIFWEFKNPSTRNAIGDRMKTGLRQLSERLTRDNNPNAKRGLVIDYIGNDSSDLVINKLIKEMNARCHHETDVILKQSDKIIKVLKIHK